MARVSSDDGFVGDTTLKGVGPNHVRNLPSGLPSVGILDFAPAPLPSTAAPPRTPHRRTPGRILREWQEFRAVWRSPVPSASALDVALDVAEQGSVAGSPVTQYPSDTAGGPDDVVDQVIVDEFAFPATIEKSEAGSDEKCPPNEHLDEDPEKLSEATGRSHAHTSLLLPIDVFRQTVWHALTAFYAPRFADPALERAYARETWSFAKVRTACPSNSFAAKRCSASCFDFGHLPPHKHGRYYVPLAHQRKSLHACFQALTIAMSPRPYVSGFFSMTSRNADSSSGAGRLHIPLRSASSRPHLATRA
jgi:hypothetical protein